MTPSRTLSSNRTGTLGEDGEKDGEGSATMTKRTGRAPFGFLGSGGEEEDKVESEEEGRGSPHKRSGTVTESPHKRSGTMIEGSGAQGFLPFVEEKSVQHRTAEQEQLKIRTEEKTEERGQEQDSGEVPRVREADGPSPLSGVMKLPSAPNMHQLATPPGLLKGILFNRHCHLAPIVCL